MEMLADGRRISGILPGRLRVLCKSDQQRNAAYGESHQEKVTYGDKKWDLAIKDG